MPKMMLVVPQTFFVPIIDVIRLFFLRVFKKKNPFIGDKNHIHHYLTSKFGKSKAIIFTFFLMLAPISIFLAGFLNFKIIVTLQFLFYLILISNYTNKLLRIFSFHFYKI